MERRLDDYNLTDDAEKELWSECLFIFDSSALLNFYSYSKRTMDDIFEKIIKPAENRLWIPNQVEYEYLCKREVSIKKPINLYKELINNHIKSIGNQLKDLKNRTKKSEIHPHIDSEIFEEFEENFLSFKETLQKEIELKISDIKKLVEEDPVLDILSTYFKVGSTYSFSNIMEVVTQGELRYRLKIPPGYKDKEEKIGIQVFGDLIIWNQIIDYAVKTRKNIIFITDDKKEDWWVLGKNNSIIAPREELIKEIRDKADIKFWMYTSIQFFESANKIQNANIQNNSLNEIEAKSDYVSTGGRLYKEGLIDIVWIEDLLDLKPVNPCAAIERSWVYWVEERITEIAKHNNQPYFQSFNFYEFKDFLASLDFKASLIKNIQALREIYRISTTYDLCRENVGRAIDLATAIIIGLSEFEPKPPIYHEE